MSVHIVNRLTRSARCVLISLYVLIYYILLGKIQNKPITNTAYASGDHTDEIQDDATVNVPEPEVTPTPTVKTGQMIGGIIAAIAAVIAIAGIVIVARRRRRI